MKNGIILTKHFKRRWAERVGTPLNPGMVQQIMCNAIKIQSSRELFDANSKPCNQLAIYWDPDLDVVIKVDPSRNSAVTVMSGGMIRPANRQAKSRRRGVKMAAVLTMHEINAGKRPKTEGGRYEKPLPRMHKPGR